MQRGAYQKGQGLVRFFLDTEFIETGPYQPIQLISISLVPEDPPGREYYAISSEFNPKLASKWVQTNVLAKLEPPELVPRKPLNLIGKEIQGFVNGMAMTLGNFDPEAPGKRLPPQFWGYYADYDWVVFCQIFGTMMNLPEGWPKYCHDIKQLYDEIGNPTPLPPKPEGEHNALADARWNRAAFKHLREWIEGYQGR